VLGGLPLFELITKLFKKLIEFMKAFKINRGVITQILEHQLRPVPIDGKETQRMHLMIEWGDEAGQQSFSWEPLLWIYRDQPGVVRDYFKDQRMLD
jgi:hypothetical protein